MAYQPDDATRRLPPSRWPSPERELRGLFEGAVQLAEASTEDAVALQALESCVGALGARGGAVRFLQGGHLHLIHHSGWPGSSTEETRILRPRFAALPLEGDSVAAGVARTGEVRALETPADVAGVAEGAVAVRDGSYVYLPIAVGGRTTGVIGLGFAGYRRFDPLTIQALAGFGQHTALALERVRLAHAQSESLRSLAVAAARAEALQRAARAFARAGNESEVLQAAVDVVFDALLPEGVSALMVQNAALHTMASRSERAAEPADPTHTALALDAPHPWAAAARCSGSMWFGGAASPRAQAGDGSLRPGRSGGAVALVVDGLAIGVLAISYAHPRVVPSPDRELFQSLAGLCAETLRRVRSQEGKRHADAQAQALHRVTAALSVATTMGEVIKVAVGELHHALRATSTVAGLVRGDNLELVDVRGRVASDRGALAVVPLARDWPPSTVLRSGRSLWHDEDRPVAEHERYGALRSGAVLPFLVDGEALGVLSIGFLDRPRIVQADREVIESVVSLCSEALRRARLFEQERAAAERYERLFAGYERLFARHPQPMAVIDEHAQEILAANEVLLGTFGYTSEELTAVRPVDLLHPSERAGVRQRQGHVEGGLADARFYPLVRVQRRDGSEFIADLTTSAVDFGGRSARLVLLNDQTAWVETEQERQRLQERVVTIAEEERRRISIDLHDGAVQELSVVAMRLGALRRQVQRGELPTPERLQALEDGAHTTVNMLRGLMQQLYPTNFGERSLGELIEEVVPSGPWASSLDVTIVDRLDRPVPSLPKAALYRVVVEALTNIHKHAGARVATVELSCRGEEFCARIVDDGIGIGTGTASAVRAGHFGLTSMRDRISLLGGRCSIENAPSGGTLVRACVPFPPAAVLDLPARMHGGAVPGGVDSERLPMTR